MSELISLILSMEMEMEMVSPSWFFYLSIALSATILHLSILSFLRKTKTPSAAAAGRLPPGPRPFPVVGSMFELGMMPHRSLARLAKTYGPVMKVRLGSVTAIVVSSPTAARETLQTKDHSLSGRFVPDAVRVFGHDRVSIVCTDSSDPYWKTLRSIIKSHLFTPHNLDSSQPLRHRKIRDLVAHVRSRAGRTVDIGQAALGSSLNLLSNTFFSVDLVDLDSNAEFEEWVSAIMKTAGSPSLADFFPALSPLDLQGCRRVVARNMDKIYRLFDQMIDRRLQEASFLTATADRDFMDTLLRFHLEQGEIKLDRPTIRAFLLDMFIAGSETSATTLEWAMAELLRHPSYMARVRAELAQVIGPGREVEESDIDRLPFLRAVVKETFRLHMPAPFLAHKAGASVELGGYTVPKGCAVWINAWAIGRDGDVWEEPDTFRPERFLGSSIDFQGRHFELLPFSSGRRVCPGLLLGHRMVHMMLASLVHFFEWGLPEGMKPGDVDVSEKFAITLSMAVPPPAIPTPVIC